MTKIKLVDGGVEGCDAPVLARFPMGAPPARYLSGAQGAPSLDGGADIDMTAPKLELAFVYNPSQGNDDDGDVSASSSSSDEDDEDDGDLSDHSRKKKAKKKAKKKEKKAKKKEKRRQERAAARGASHIPHREQWRLIAHASDGSAGYISEAELGAAAAASADSTSVVTTHSGTMSTTRNTAACKHKIAVGVFHRHPETRKTSVTMCPLPQNRIYHFLPTKVPTENAILPAVPDSHPAAAAIASSSRSSSAAAAPGATDAAHTTRKGAVVQSSLMEVTTKREERLEKRFEMIDEFGSKKSQRKIEKQRQGQIAIDDVRSQVSIGTVISPTRKETTQAKRRRVEEEERAADDMLRQEEMDVEKQRRQNERDEARSERKRAKKELSASQKSKGSGSDEESSSSSSDSDSDDDAVDDAEEFEQSFAKLTFPDGAGHQYLPPHNLSKSIRSPHHLYDLSHIIPPYQQQNLPLGIMWRMITTGDHPRDIYQEWNDTAKKGSGKDGDGSGSDSDSGSDNDNGNDGDSKKSKTSEDDKADDSSSSSSSGDSSSSSMMDLDSLNAAAALVSNTGSGEAGKSSRLQYRVWLWAHAKIIGRLLHRDRHPTMISSTSTSSSIAAASAAAAGEEEGTTSGKRQHPRWRRSAVILQWLAILVEFFHLQRNDKLGRWDEVMPPHLVSDQVQEHLLRMYCKKERNYKLGEEKKGFDKSKMSGSGIDEDRFKYCTSDTLQRRLLCHIFLLSILAMPDCCVRKGLLFGQARWLKMEPKDLATYYREIGAKVTYPPPREAEKRRAQEKGYTAEKGMDARLKAPLVLPSFKTSRAR